MEWTLIYILVATLAGGLLSVTIAAALTVSLLGRLVKGLVSLSAGVLLGRRCSMYCPKPLKARWDRSACS